MAKITSGVGTTHVPAIGAAQDHDKTQDEYWRPLFEGYGPARAWARDHTPDVAIVIFNDHANAMGLDFIPTFALGVGDVYQPADEGYGRRKVPPLQGHPELAWHLVENLIMDEFDMTIINDLDVDHGCTVPLSVLYDQPDQWPCRIIPLWVNVLQYPSPSGKRCFALGQALRRAVDSFPEDLNVAVFGTGGMSHQLQGERAGLVNEPFDRAFLDDLTADPGRLTRITHLEYIREAGAEGSELVMWLVMRGALANPKELYRFYHMPASNTGAGLIILDDATPNEAPT